MFIKFHIVNLEFSTVYITVLFVYPENNLKPFFKVDKKISDANFFQKIQTICKSLIFFFQYTAAL